MSSDRPVIVMNMAPVPIEIVRGRLMFPNGYMIGVDEIWKGQVLYHVWPPGVESQGMFERAYRRPVAEFAALVKAEGGVYADAPVASDGY
jgi:hypothetical protein